MSDDVFDMIRALNAVKKDLRPLRRELRAALALVVGNVLMNVVALVLYYCHLGNPAFVIIRMVLGFAGFVVVYRAFRAIRKVEQKYSAP